MPSSSHRSKESEGSRPKPTLTDLLKSRIVWTMVAVMGIIGGGISTWAHPRISAALDEATETGNSVEVNYEVRPVVRNMWLPSERHLLYNEIEPLYGLGLLDQSKWWIDHGAIPVGWRDIEVDLRGNRHEQLRITDLRPVSDCEPVREGSLVTLNPPIGGTPTTTHIGLEVEDNSKPPTYFDYEAFARGEYEGPVNFFDAKTITLDQDEHEYFLIRLFTRDSICRVDMEMTIIEDGKRHTQMLLGKGNEITVGPSSDQPVRERMTGAYMGGQICEEYVMLPPEVMQMDYETLCGPGNLIFDPMNVQYGG